MPHFRIQYPEKGIETDPQFHDDSIIFYNNLFEILNKLGHTFEKTNNTHDGRAYPNCISLGHHSTSKDANVWSIKKGYVPYYFYFDKTGYGGWAEIADNQCLFEDSQKVDPAVAEDFVDSFLKSYSESNSSKYTQTLQDFSPVKKDYVFVACQIPNDTVAQFARIPTFELALETISRLKDSGLGVVVKLHPETEGIVRGLPEAEHVQYSQASIHQIIPGAQAVITVNSGVGFEALLYRKRVFCSGHSDYHWGTHSLQNKNDIGKIPALLEEAVDRETINKFLYFMLREYFVDVRDKQSILQHIKRALSEYES